MKRLFTPIGRMLTAHETLIEIEPGLLPIFRTMTALQFGMALLGTIASLIEPEHEMPPGLGLVFFSVAWTGLLCFYLFATPRFQRLGRAYLPLALLFATLCTLGEYLWEFPILVEILQQEDELALLVSVSGWRLLSGLVTPLLIVASQYGWRSIVLFIVTVIGAELFAFRQFLSAYAEIGAFSVVQAVIFGLIGYIVNRLIAAQRVQRRALAAANAQLAQHAATLEQLTISRERNRLARELHDTLAHTLSAVSVQLEAVDSAWDLQPTRARELLGKSLATTRSGLTETRRALHSLRASPLDDLGLPLAIRTLAESTAKRAGLALHLTIDELEPLLPDVEQHLYRIAQEALANVVKHSGAHTLQVQLTSAPERAHQRVTLAIADDGQGFDVSTAQANGHFGLRGMHERAQLIGATLTVESTPTDGTTVRLVLA